MTSPRSTLAAALMLTAVVAGCASSSGPSASPPPEASLAPSVPPRSSPHQPAPTPPAGVVGQVPESVLVLVREDLAQRLGVDVTNATVVEAESVTFSDGSLDCPEPGMGYTQALVEGYRVVVELDGRQYDYRIPQQGAPKLCDQLAPGRG